jgi:hypothetical protein
MPWADRALELYKLSGDFRAACEQAQLEYEKSMSFASDNESVTTPGYDWDGVPEQGA